MEVDQNTEEFPLRKEPDHRGAWFSFLTLTEVLLVFFAAIVVTSLLTLPLLIRFDAVVPLEPSRARVDEPSTLLADSVILELARSVELESDDNGTQLKLGLVHSKNEVRTVLPERLVKAGYGIDGLRFRPTLNLEPAAMDVTMVRRSLAIQAAVFLVVGASFARWRWRREPFARRGSPLSVIAWGIGGGVASFLASGILSQLLSAVGVTVEEQAWVQEILSDRSNLITLAPWIAIAAPLAEETFFRAYVFRFLRDRIGFRTGLFLSSVLFAAVHLNLPALPVYVTIGSIFGLVYARTSSLATPFLAHVTHNSIVLAVSAIALDLGA